MMKKIKNLFVILAISLFTFQFNIDLAFSEEPKYGGKLSFYFWGQEVPSADVNKNNWVTRMYISPVLNRLVEVDFVKFGPRGSSEFTQFTTDKVPEKYSRGALAKSWEVNPEKIVFNIRKGVMWVANGKENVMKSRAYDANDCAFSLNRLVNKNKGWKTENGGFIDSIYAQDKYTCVVKTSKYSPNAFTNLTQHVTSVQYAPEVIKAGAGNWDNLVGTGPFLLKEAVVGSHISYLRNPNYWNTTNIDGKKYKLPFIDELIMPILPDESTQIASLRTGKLDLMGTVSVNYKDTLAKTSPDLKNNGWVEIWPVVLALNMKNKYLSDKKVRQALMTAVDQDAIIKAAWGYGASYNFPVDWRDGSSILGPFDELPSSIKDLYQYNPSKAKKLLAESGYPKGFKAEIVFSPAATAGTHGEIATMISANFAEIGVELKLKSLEATSLSSLMQSRKGYDILSTNVGSKNPLGMFGSLANYSDKNKWNTPNYNNTKFTALHNKAKNTVDTKERNAILKEMALMLMDDVAYIPIGASGRFGYWWPWVKNYYGEAMSGGTSIGPYIGALWIDQKLKSNMGY